MEYGGAQMASKSPKRGRAPEETPGPKADEASQGGATGGLTQVSSLDELVRKPGSYLTVRLESPRWWLNIMHFADGNYKIRISAITGGGIVTIANVNASRLDDLINILQRVKQRLNEKGVKTSVERQREEVI